MGRVISGLADAILAVACVADIPLNLVIGMDILMFVVLVISLAAGGYLLIGQKMEKWENDRKSAGESEISPKERLKMYAQHCSLTIYEKTETKTRLGLFQSYMNYTID